MTAFLPLVQAEWGTVPDWVTKRPRRSRKDYYNAWIASELDHLDY